MNQKLLSLIIPARNEEKSILATVSSFSTTLKREKIPFEIIVIDDHSIDHASDVMKKYALKNKEIFVFQNTFAPGFGFAIRTGLEHFHGSYVAIVMADLSDDPHDLVKMYKKAKEGYDCVFGNRFIKGAWVINYPIHKLVLNRLVNNGIRFLFMIRYKDVTNAFKLYSRETIEGLRPILSNYFNITVELPLKAIIRGYRYAVIPTNWTGRKIGISRLKLTEMGSRYFFIILYCFLEKILSHGDYKKQNKKR